MGRIQAIQATLTKDLEQLVKAVCQKNDGMSYDLYRGVIEIGEAAGSFTGGQVGERIGAILARAENFDPALKDNGSLKCTFTGADIFDLRERGDIFVRDFFNGDAGKLYALERKVVLNKAFTKEDADILIRKTFEAEGRGSRFLVQDRWTEASKQLSKAAEHAKKVSEEIMKDREKMAEAAAFKDLILWGATLVTSFVVGYAVGDLAADAQDLRLDKVSSLEKVVSLPAQKPILEKSGPVR